MDNKLKLLSEKKNRLDALSPLPAELVDNLEDWLGVELTYSSNAIEGNSLSRVETAEVLERGIGAVVSGKSLKDQLEAINHAKALELIKRLVIDRKGHQFITEQDIKNIQKVILTGVADEWAGVYRQTEIFIRGSNSEFPSPKQVPNLMKNFISWLHNLQEGHPVKIAADAHFKLANIHPFRDGNGRTARLLMNLILLMHGYPMAVIRNEDRIEYLASFDMARENNNMDPFYDIVENAVDRSLDMYLEVAQPENGAEISKEQRFYTTDEVARLLKVDPESVRRYVRSHKLRAVKLGGKFIRIEKSDLDKFIEQLKT